MSRREDGQDARNKKELIEKLKITLNQLRSGERFQMVDFDVDRASVPNCIHRLRHSWGFTIEGCGSKKKPYHMPIPDQKPQLISTTTAMRDAYYESEHWQGKRSERLEHDGYTCIKCGVSFEQEELEVHHDQYDLFEEDVLHHLVTLCKPCHRLVTENGKFTFPIGMWRDHLDQLEIDVDWPLWTMPSYPDHDPLA
ncbi:MAG: HNH endonuclease signature motif containing protein [Verrucomicrobiales bacterium]|jgi:hypothetical protein|nr:HNH endonuclease signature motif containing protein [Verrucomicrobiales bacterium]